MSESPGGPLLVAVVGGKAAGKTTLVEAILRALSEAGVRAAAIKHTHEASPEVDRPGTDSWRMAAAGASTVVLASPNLIAVFRSAPTDLEGALGVVRCVDPGARVVLIEGFKSQAIPREDVVKVVIGGDRRIEKMLKSAGGEVWRVRAARDKGGAPRFEPQEIREITRRILHSLGRPGRVVGD
ncbi:MAG: molybdopterin-guanine dinucleotide biosynthesis protein B [Candidatus Korarchaeota archaeon]|nr:molybdopterin-guanine dinucleotide biosynthesis protein B [Candidatus Korarchaeota archaeon]